MSTETKPIPGSEEWRDKILTAAADSLGEHFSSVLILTTTDEGGVHYQTSTGRGPFGSQRHAADQWLKLQEEREIVQREIKVSREFGLTDDE